MPSGERMQHRDRNPPRCRSEDVVKSSCGASKSAWLAPSVSWHLGSRPGCRCSPAKPQTRPDKAKSSIVRRLRGLSYWFEPPIPRFRRHVDVAIGVRPLTLGVCIKLNSPSRRQKPDPVRIRAKLWQPESMLAVCLSGDVGRQHELKYRAALS